jgi:hypothetical protein
MNLCQNFVSRGIRKQEQQPFDKNLVSDSAIFRRDRVERESQDVSLAFLRAVEPPLLAKSKFRLKKGNFFWNSAKFCMKSI